jgi:hypothetical protein
MVALTLFTSFPAAHTGDDSDLHIIIFDEIDAICPARCVYTCRMDLGWSLFKVIH